MTIDDDLDIRSFNRLKLQLRFAVFFFKNEKEEREIDRFQNLPVRLLRRIRHIQHRRDGPGRAILAIWRKLHSK